MRNAGGVGGPISAPNNRRKSSNSTQKKKNHEPAQRTSFHRSTGQDRYTKEGAKDKKKKAGPKKTDTVTSRGQRKWNSTGRERGKKKKNLENRKDILKNVSRETLRIQKKKKNHTWMLLSIVKRK